jgi:HEAT repeat protein
MFCSTLTAMAIMLTGMAAEKAAAPAAGPPDKASVDAAFEALKTFDWGQERKVLVPLEQVLMISKGDAAARKDLETRLLAILTSGAPRAAKDFVCRQLSLIGTAESIPAVAALLSDKDLSHMARYVLERIAGPESVKVMREALPKLSGRPQVGVINSLGARGDAQSVAALAGLLSNADPEVAAAAVAALGAIGTPEAAEALCAFQKKAPEKLVPVAANACLACAERLLAAGKKAEAVTIYKSFIGPEQPKHVRLAATRGMLAAAGKEGKP